MTRAHPSAFSDGAAGPLLTVSAITAGPERDWQDDALCAQVDADMFFPEKGGSVAEARRVCHWCDVRDRCLEYALEMEGKPGVTGRFGIFGGKTARERSVIAARRGATPGRRAAA